MTSSRPAVFLDRDGTLNVQVTREGRPYPPGRVEEFQLFPGTAEICRDLKGAGFALVVVTNQPDVGRGEQSQSEVEAMHQRLSALVPEIDRIEVCYAPGRGIAHPDNHRRKPAPGMLLDAARDLGLDLARSWMVGDRSGDMAAGRAAGCRTIFIDHQYNESGPGSLAQHTVRSLAEAAAIILARPDSSN